MRSIFPPPYSSLYVLWHGAVRAEEPVLAEQPEFSFLHDRLNAFRDCIRVCSSFKVVRSEESPEIFFVFREEDTEL
jgi:hypothetical protein